jgi:hypothetical protein
MLTSDLFENKTPAAWRAGYERGLRYYRQGPDNPYPAGSEEAKDYADGYHNGELDSYDKYDTSTMNEGAVKELSQDLRSMSDAEFLARYKMTKAQARAEMKSGVTESYPKHQDLSGISTDKLEAYLAKQSRQQVPGEGNQVKRVQTELQRRQQGLAEVSKATLDRYVEKAVDAHGHADFAARQSKDDPTLRSYHVDQKKTAEKRRQGISRALDRMSKTEGVAEGANDMTPNWAKYVLDQIYNSDGAVTLTDLFDEGIPGLHDMFMATAEAHGLDPEEEFEDVQHELTVELEDLIKGGHEEGVAEGNNSSPFNQEQNLRSKNNNELADLIQFWNRALEKNPEHKVAREQLGLIKMIRAGRVGKKGVAEAEKNPHTSALGKALYRDLSKEKKASPAQVEKNKAQWAKNPHNPANKQQGVAEGVAETLSMDEAKKVLRQYGADNFKTTSNELHFYKNGRPFSVDLIFNSDATRSVNLSQLNSATRRLKGQGVTESYPKHQESKSPGADDELQSILKSAGIDRRK